MRQKRYTPEEIVSKLRQVDVLVSQGTPVADAIRAIGGTEVAPRRTAGWRDFLLTAGGQSCDRELATTVQPCIGTPIWLCHWREEVLLIGTRSRGVFGVPSGSLCDGLSAG